MITNKMITNTYMNKPGETIMNKMPKPINDDKLNSPEEAKRYFSLHDTDKMLDWLERGIGKDVVHDGTIDSEKLMAKEKFYDKYGYIPETLDGFDLKELGINNTEPDDKDNQEKE